MSIGPAIQASFLTSGGAVSAFGKALQRKSAIQLRPGIEAFPVDLRPKHYGLPLPRDVQAKMEQALGASFADVRVHVGSEAASIGAIAFTWGSDIHFAPGQYNPHTPQGQFLLGHELAHVIQQRAGRVSNPFGSGLAVVQDQALESEADRMGRLASSFVHSSGSHRPAAVAGGHYGTSPVIDRKPTAHGAYAVLPAALKGFCTHRNFGVLPAPAFGGAKPCLMPPRTAGVNITGIQAMLRRSGNLGLTPPPSPPPSQRNRHSRSNSVEMADVDGVPQYGFVPVPAIPAAFVAPNPVPTKKSVAWRMREAYVDKHGNELFAGKRLSAHWENGFVDAFAKAKPKVCPNANSECSKDFEIDHKTSFYRLLEQHATKQNVCDGKNHFDAYIYRFKNDLITYPVAKMPSKKDNSVARLYHWNDNLQWMCDTHNPSKSGKKDPDGQYDITYLEPCPGPSCKL